jgi:hypothetical protein
MLNQRIILSIRINDNLQEATRTLESRGSKPITENGSGARRELTTK